MQPVIIPGAGKVEGGECCDEGVPSEMTTRHVRHGDRKDLPRRASRTGRLEQGLVDVGAIDVRCCDNVKMKSRSRRSDVDCEKMSQC